MNNLDINENDKKLNLIKQIYEYNNKGYKLNKYYSISDLSGKPKPSKEELLKFGYGSNEYYEYYKQQLK